MDTKDLRAVNKRIRHCINYNANPDTIGKQISLAEAKQLVMLYRKKYIHLSLSSIKDH